MNHIAYYDSVRQSERSVRVVHDQGMDRTYTPELDFAVLDRLTGYASLFRDHFHHPRQAAYCGVYLQGPLLDGDRKSIEPMSRQVHLPDGLTVASLEDFANARL